MSDIGIGYGSESGLTVTHLNSLPDGSTWQSAAQTNTNAVATGIGSEDVQLLITVTPSTSGLSSNPYCTVALCASLDGGTTFTDGASSSEGTYTPAGNAIPLGTIVCAASGAPAFDIGALQTSPGAAIGALRPKPGGQYSLSVSIGSVLGAVPQNWVVTVTNNTGAALASSGNSVEIQGPFTQTS